MIVSDVMSPNMVTISSHTSLAEARRILDSHGFRRLPVMDKEKLVGVVTKEALDRTGPSQLTTFSVHEKSYLLIKVSGPPLNLACPPKIGPGKMLELDWFGLAPIFDPFLV